MREGVNINRFLLVFINVFNVLVDVKVELYRFRVFFRIAFEGLKLRVFFFSFGLKVVGV